MALESLSRTDLGGIAVAVAVVAVLFGARAFRFPTLEPVWVGPTISVVVTAAITLLVGLATLVAIDRLR